MSLPAGRQACRSQTEMRKAHASPAYQAGSLPIKNKIFSNENEYQILISQIATSKRGGRRKLPYVFSEHGVLMLSSVLNSKQAIQVNIQVMRVFTRIRQKDRLQT